MRNVLLSMTPRGWELIKNGKVFEYRKRYIAYLEETKAYLYISKPQSVIMGVLELGKPTKLEDWRNKYKDDLLTCSRIESYMHRGNRVVMQINKIYETNCITREEIKCALGRFVVPQGFYYLDDTSLLDYLNSNIHVISPIPVKNITSDDICRDYTKWLR